MMKQCLKCQFYDPEIDEHERMHNDTGGDNDHFCVMWGKRC